MNNMKRSLKRIFWLVFVMFSFIIIGLLKIVIIDSNDFITNSYNPRLNYSQEGVIRGDILDSAGNTLAYTSVEEGNYVRNYVYSNISNHVIGYTGVGKSGVEASQNFELQKIHNEIIQRFKNIMFGDFIKGNSVVLTINKDIQYTCEKALGNNKGAIVVMEPSTGRIIAMASKPDYDINKVAENWENLRQDENSPLLNRATQGVYPPGSVFKIVTATAAIRNMPDWESFVYECKGEETFDGKIIHCFDEKAHGKIDIYEAMAVSCNCFFAKLGQTIGGEKIKETGEALYFNKDIDFLLPSSKPIISVDNSSTESEIVETSIGQGKTTVTPLYMAMLMSAVADNGLMMKPYIVDHIQYYNGKIGKKTVPEKIDRIFSESELEKLKSMLFNVVDYGTGKKAKPNQYTAAGKTGTAENSSGDDHSWFVGYAPADNPKVVISIVLENSGSGKSTPIAKKIFDYILENMNN